MMRALSGILAIGLCLAVWASPAAQAGAPSPINPWTKREYVDFYFSHFNGNLALPHLREPQSKAMFERIVDPKNVLLITDSPKSMQEKQREIILVLSIMGEIRAAYAYAVLVGEPLQEELTRVRTFTLYVLDTAIWLSGGDINPQRKDALRTTFLGVADALSERTLYSGRQIADLSSALAEHYPTISQVLADADRRDFRERIKRLKKAEQDPAVEAAYAQLLRTCEEQLAP
jgi:hypothetical protein